MLNTKMKFIFLSPVLCCPYANPMPAHYSVVVVSCGRHACVLLEGDNAKRESFLLPQLVSQRLFLGPILCWLPCVFLLPPASQASPLHIFFNGCFPVHLLTGFLPPQDLCICCSPTWNIIPATLYLDNFSTLHFPRDTFSGRPDWANSRLTRSHGTRCHSISI